MHRSGPHGGPSAERRSRHKPPSITQMLSPIDNSLQIKISFLQRVSLGIQTTLKARPHAQQEMANTELIHWQFFCRFFASGLFVLTLQFLSVCFMAYGFVFYGIYVCDPTSLCVFLLTPFLLFVLPYSMFYLFLFYY